MSAEPCASAGLAQAVDDGRLSELDRASFERHAEHCVACGRELVALRELSAAARRLPGPVVSQLEHRRSRQRLLQRANQQVLAPTTSRRRRSWAFALAAALLVLSTGVWIGARRPAVGIPSYEVVASADADWYTEQLSTTLRLRLRGGRLELEVHKLEVGQRFLVALPDGELEVQGTHFQVSAEHSRTRAVSVREGRVALRLARRPVLVLTAGQSWSLEPVSVSPEQPAKAAEATQPTQPTPDTQPARAPRPPASTQGRAAGRTTMDGPRAGDTGAVARAAPLRGADFAAGMQAFQAEDYANAESRFIEFERGHPGDSRIEDSTFLRALSRARRGDTAGADAIAREYLLRYPEGLRRPEAMQLLR